jgi:3-hydroxyacyl-[acyl-carrier-protein] dehydratase
VPFILIDRLLELRPGTRARACRTFSPADPLFDDHFPGFAIVPAVLITEAMAQTAGWLLGCTQGFSRRPVLTMIHKAKFRKLVFPGDELELLAEIVSRRNDDFEVLGEARVKTARVADVTLQFHTFDLSLAAAARDQFETWARDTFRRLGGEALLEEQQSWSTTIE